MHYVISGSNRPTYKLCSLVFPGLHAWYSFREKLYFCGQGQSGLVFSLRKVGYNKPVSYSVVSAGWDKRKHKREKKNILFVLQAVKKEIFDDIIRKGKEAELNSFEQVIVNKFD